MDFFLKDFQKISDQNMLLSIVFSFRNEADNIPELVRRVHSSVSTIEDLTYELIFVNDDSRDNSLEILDELKVNYPITIVNMSRRFGVSPCVLAGFSMVRGDAAIYMDADLQDPPELIPRLVEKFRDGADVVHTTRLKREGEGFVKLWLTKKAYKIINYFSEIPLPKDSGDFKLLSARALSQVLSLKEYDPYMRGLSVWIGFKQDFVFYNREARFGGKTKFPLIGSSGPIKEFIRGLTAYSAAPLYASFFLGLVVCLGAAVLIIWSIVTKLMGISAPGTSGILIAIAFFSGVILLTNGIIGVYLAKIYYEVKGRPKYIIKDVSSANRS